jgi:quercetin dioxygenase-like cupin family protein
MSDLQPGTGRLEETDWGSLRWLANSQLGNARDVTVGRVVINPGSANPRHAHDSCEEVVYVLDGHIEHTLADRTLELRRGEVLVVPPGVVHNARNLGSTPVDLLVVYSTGTRDVRPAQ